MYIDNKFIHSSFRDAIEADAIDGRTPKAGQEDLTAEENGIAQVQAFAAQ